MKVGPKNTYFLRFFCEIGQNHGLGHNYFIFRFHKNKKFGIVLTWPILNFCYTFPSPMKLIFFGLSADAANYHQNSVARWEMILTKKKKQLYINIINLCRSTAASLLQEFEAQSETCRQGGGEKGIARHVKLNKKVPT